MYKSGVEFNSTPLFTFDAEFLDNDLEINISDNLHNTE